MAGTTTEQAPVASARRRPPRLLVVCTANVCRSPMARGILARRLRDADVMAKVRSSGFLGSGHAPAKEGVAALAEMGIDISPHRSRSTSLAMVAGADVVITMERQHVRDLMGVEMSAWPRVFPLRSLVERAQQIGERHGDEELSAWIERLHHGRKAADLLVADASEDIADPIGLPLSEFRSTARELDRLLSTFVQMAFPPGAPKTVPAD